MRRNMPDPLPAMLLGRLAVDRRYHNQRLGSAVLRNAMLRTLSISQETGVTLMFVRALHDQAKQFYLSLARLCSVTVTADDTDDDVATAQAIIMEPDDPVRAAEARSQLR